MQNLPLKLVSNDFKNRNLNAIDVAEIMYHINRNLVKIDDITEQEDQGETSTDEVRNDIHETDTNTCNIDRNLSTTNTANIHDNNDVLL